MSYNYTSDFNDGSLTRGEALDAIEEAQNDHNPLTALRDLSEAWIGHRQDGMELHELIELLREYVSEACMDLDGDAIRANGPKDSDYTGISA